MPTPTIIGLDPAAIGNALVTLAMTSRLLGHDSIAGTARDYLVRHETEGNVPPEWQFVYDLVLSGQSPMLSTDLAIQMLQTVPWPTPAGTGA